MHSKHKGSKNELIAACWLLENGFEVFRNVSTHGLVDLIALKESADGGIDITLIDVKGIDQTKRYGNISNKQRKWNVRILGVRNGTCEFLQILPVKNPAFCKQCGKLVTGQRTTYCSAKCSAVYRNKLYNNKIGKAAKPKASCQNCGIELTGRNSKFCKACGYIKDLEHSRENYKKRLAQQQAERRTFSTK